MKKMTNKEVFLVKCISNISIIIAMLFPVSFIIKGGDFAEKVISFQPFANCDIKIITLMSFSPVIAVMLSIALYGIMMMRVTFRNLK